MKAVYEGRALVLEELSKIDALLLRNRFLLSLAITDPMVDVKAESTPIEKTLPRSATHLPPRANGVCPEYNDREVI